MSDTLIWIILLFAFLIIIGLYCTGFTPLDLTEKQKILKLNNTIENFVSYDSHKLNKDNSHKSKTNNIEHFSSSNETNIVNENKTETFSPSTSSDSERSTGASHLYNWGLPDNNIYDFHKCNDKCPKECKEKNINNITVNNCTPRPADVNVNEVCKKCDITLNNNIDKYVLKSSVPSCPDMSEFITKNMMNANPDLSDYILKSEIKPCPNIDLSDYILKNSVPPCPDCPTCPECPICPVCPTCPPEKQCKNIYEYQITEHPDINKYISKENIKNDYISKKDIEKEYISKKDIEKEYIKKSIVPKCIPSKCDDSDLKKGLTNIFQKIRDNLFGKIEEQKKEIQELKNNNEKNCNQNIKNNDKKKPDTPYDNLNIFDDNYHSELLSDDVQGYYAGDSAFAGV